MSSGARRLNLIDWLKSPSFMKCDEDHRGDLIAEYLNGSDFTPEPLEKLSKAIFGDIPGMLTPAQKVALMQDAALSAENSTYADDNMRRVLALDVLTFSMEILVDPILFGANDRNEAALIAGRMPRIIAFTYAEL